MGRVSLGLSGGVCGGLWPYRSPRGCGGTCIIPQEFHLAMEWNEEDNPRIEARKGAWMYGGINFHGIFLVELFLSGQSIGFPLGAAHQVSRLYDTRITSRINLETRLFSVTEDEPPSGPSPSNGPNQASGRKPVRSRGEYPLFMRTERFEGELLARPPFSRPQSLDAQVANV